MSAKEDDSILMEGIFYSYDGNRWKDLYRIKHNPDNYDLFDIDLLTDQSVRKPYDINLFLQMLYNTIYFDPFRRLVVSYQDKKNVEFLIDVIHNFYSNRSCGIRQITPIPLNTTLDSLLPSPENQLKFSSSVTFHEKMMVNGIERNPIIA